MARTFTKKLFQIRHEQQESFVLADSVPDAVRQWQGSSTALAKADPSAVVLVSADVIGAPPRGTVIAAPATPADAEQAQGRLHRATTNAAELGLI